MSQRAVTESQHAQYHDPDTEAAQKNSALFNLLFAPVLFLTCPNVTETCWNILSYCSICVHHHRPAAASSSGATPPPPQKKRMLPCNVDTSTRNSFSSSLHLQLPHQMPITMNKFILTVLKWMQSISCLDNTFSLPTRHMESLLYSY